MLEDVGVGFAELVSGEPSRRRCFPLLVLL